MHPSLMSLVVGFQHHPCILGKHLYSTTMTTLNLLEGRVIVRLLRQAISVPLHFPCTKASCLNPVSSAHLNRLHPPPFYPTRITRILVQYILRDKTPSNGCIRKMLRVHLFLTGGDSRLEFRGVGRWVGFTFCGGKARTVWWREGDPVRLPSGDRKLDQPLDRAYFSDRSCLSQKGDD
jgi:hypothetical protein